MIVSILNKKGGAGKTTLAINLAHAFQLSGDSVLLIDSDQQASTREWHEQNGGTKLEVVGLDRPTLATDIERLNFKHKWIFIDGVPKLSVMAAISVRIADVVLIPVQPSPYDAWACGDIVALIKERQELTGGYPKAAFVITRNQPNTLMGKDVRDSLEVYGLPIFLNYTTQRVIYSHSAVAGNTVLDFPESPAAIEVNCIMDELKEFSHGINKD